MVAMATLFRPDRIGRKKPDIRGVRLIVCDAVRDVMPHYNGRYIVATTDGRFFERGDTDDEQMQAWREMFHDGDQSEPFFSDFLEEAVEKAKENGLKPQKSAYTIYLNNLAERQRIIEGENETELADMDEKYPAVFDPSAEYLFDEDEV